MTFQLFLKILTLYLNIVVKKFLSGFPNSLEIIPSSSLILSAPLPLVNLLHPIFVQLLL